MFYTRTGIKEVEDYLQEKISIVSKIIKRRIPDTISIIMSGGFGKGEGSISYDKGKIILINDFDMYLITKRKYSEEKINDVAQEASNKIGKRGISSFVKFNKDRPVLEEFFYIDLKAIPFKDLKKLPPMVKFYDLRNSSQVVYGRNLLKEIPDFKAEKLPLAEGARFLLNRMSHLIQHFYLSFLTEDVRENDHQIFLLHVLKTYTDACTALLILSGDYLPKYNERINLFKKIYEKKFPELARMIPEYPDKIEEFTKLKFNFDLNAYKGRDLELWKQSRDYIGVTTKYFFEQFLNKNIKDYYELSAAIKESAIDYYIPYIQYILKKRFKLKIDNKNILGLSAIGAHLYMNLLYFFRMIQYHKKIYLRGLLRMKPPELTFFSALPLILYSLRDDGSVDLKMLEDGRRILEEVYPVNIKHKGSDLKYWENITKVYSNAYVLFAFLKMK